MYKPLSLYQLQGLTLKPLTDTHLSQTQRKCSNFFFEAVIAQKLLSFQKEMKWYLTVKYHFISFVVAIAEVYKNEGNDEYHKKNFNSAIRFYTKGIKVNCKDEDLNAKLYSNRAAAHFNLGKRYVVWCILALKYLTFGLLNWLGSLSSALRNFPSRVSSCYVSTSLK